jgi:hypothetical protein
VGARLPRRADQPFEAGIGQSERARLRVSPEGARASQAVDEAGRLRYRDVYPATDVVYVATVERLEWFLLLRDQHAPTRFAWKVELAPELAAARLEPSGALSFLDARGEARLQVPRPFVVDATGARRSAELGWDGHELRVSFDPAGLQWPVLLDPAIEPAAWTRKQPPGARTFAALAYDSARGVSVLFGGNDGSWLGDTWEWNGSAWSLRATSGPSPRRNAGLAYDSARGVTVLFGGYYYDDKDHYLGDTWEWDGTTWSERVVPGPPARTRHALAFDSTRARTVLYGGIGTASYLSDTWEWDGSTWVQRVVTGTGSSADHGMAFDAARGRTVLFGGGVVGTWEWDGTSWVQRATTGPSPRSYPAMAYDAARARTLLFGGLHNFTLGDTWEWDGSAWTQRASSGPTARATQVAYDSQRGRTVMFGGYQVVSGLPVANAGDTWEWDGNTWTQSIGVDKPAERYFHAMAFDSIRARAVVFGGYTYGSVGSNGDTWEWDGSTWSLRTTSGPAARYLHAMSFDSARGQTVLFGGEGPTNASETWEWDGSTWSLRAASGPAPRIGHAMAYDAARAKTVLFGGDGGGGQNDLADTWEWDGATWSLRSSDGPARSGHAMTFDAKRARTLLWGGFNYARYTSLGDTWEWDGASWTRRALVGPPAGTSARLAFDAARGRAVLFGGEVGGVGLTFNSGLWEWDGSSWYGYDPGGPGVRFGHALVFDSARSAVLLFGGFSYNLLADTWEYRGPGKPCLQGSDCASASCVDGVCCDVASCGTCASCNAATPGSCAPLLSRQDPDTCAGASACDSSGTCVARAANGSACTGDELCVSGHCADGTCCNVDCAGSCQTCAATPGTCTAVKGAEDPDSCTGSYGCGAAGTCKKKNGQWCSSGDLCQSTFCADGTCCDTACDGGCDACNLSGSIGVCKALPSGSLGTPSCAPYVCRGGSTCPTSCTDPFQCTAGNWCVGGTCGPPRPNGTACTDLWGCESHSCVDGVCCDSDCVEACARCDLPGPTGVADGVCRYIAGADPDHECPGSGACAGVCDGHGACGYPGALTSCGTCARCDGGGACAEKPVDDTSCGPIACDGLSTACRQYLSVSQNRCSALGVCASPDDPSRCTRYVDAPDGTSCATGVCVAGACVAPFDGGTPPDLAIVTVEEGASGCSCALATRRGSGSGASAELLLAIMLALAMRRGLRLRRP